MALTCAKRAGGLAGLWTAEQRELFLLRVDVAAPLSTDTLVWPSVFDTGQVIGMPSAERERLHMAGIPMPAYTGPNAGLWEDAASLRHYVMERRAAAPPCVVVAVSWFSGNGPSESGDVGPYPARTLPATPDPGWQWLGFDVADGSLLSGLTNCGYRADEAPALRAQWAGSLNGNHLFDELHDARQFRALAELRVPEHAPFFVYGLYLIEELPRQP